MVPQFTPTAPTTENMVEVMVRKVNMKNQNIWVGLRVCVVKFDDAENGRRNEKCSLGDCVSGNVPLFSFQVLVLLSGFRLV